jgi:hypothetical protein
VVEEFDASVIVEVNEALVAEFSAEAGTDADSFGGRGFELGEEGRGGFGDVGVLPGKQERVAGFVGQEPSDHAIVQGTGGVIGDGPGLPHVPRTRPGDGRRTFAGERGPADRKVLEDTAALFVFDHKVTWKVLDGDCVRLPGSKAVYAVLECGVRD